MMPKLATALASAQGNNNNNNNRSFVKQSRISRQTSDEQQQKHNEILVNRSFSGFVNRAFVKESLSRNSNNNSNSTSVVTALKEPIPVLPTAPTKSSSTTSSERDEDEVCEQASQTVGDEPSSFWNEWAEDMLQHDNDASSNNSSGDGGGDVAKKGLQGVGGGMRLGEQPESSFYEDPSFAIPEGEDDDDDASTVGNDTSAVTATALSNVRWDSKGQKTAVAALASTALGAMLDDPDGMDAATIDDSLVLDKEPELVEETNTTLNGEETLDEKKVEDAPIVLTPTKEGQPILESKPTVNNETTTPNYDVNESIDTLALMNMSQATEGMVSILKKKERRNDDRGQNMRQTMTAAELNETRDVASLPPLVTNAIVPVSTAVETEEDEEEDDDDQSMFYPMHTSINTYAVMNISQATVNVTAMNKTMNDTDMSFSYQAMEFSSAATELLQTQHHVEALEMFQKAADCYTNAAANATTNAATATSTSPKEASILASVNAAGCYRNMSAVSRMLERYEEGADYLRKAEALYVTAREAVDVQSSRAILTVDGQEVNSSSPALHNMSVVSCYTTDEESMCLDAMILETLQSRATFHVKFQDDSEQAVECYEQCLKHLIHLNSIQRWDDDEEEMPVREQGVTFVQLSKEKHTAFLVQSLESLGGLYRTLVRDTTCTACLTVYEDALDILQNRQEKEEPNHDGLIGSVSQILRYLSEIYFGRQELDRAVDALHDSTAVKLTASGEPCREALEVMDKMGAANEKMENWEKALSCYEQSLFARCRFFGNTHWNVAKSLVNVARVMERKDGSTKESIELYKAANAIFALQMTSEGPDLGDDVEAILQLIPTVIRQGRYEKAVADLNKCLAMAEDKKNAGLALDKAQIYFDLGRAYMGMNDHKMATESLMNAIKQVGDVNDEKVFTLLQHVEFMQQDEQSKGVAEVVAGGHSVLMDKSGVVLQDPTVSFHDITFQLQGESSVYVFEDDASNGGKKGEPEEDEPSAEKDPQESNPQYDILYQSFTREAKQKSSTVGDTRFSLGNAVRSRLPSPKSSVEGDATPRTTATEQSALRSKVSVQVTKILKRMKEARVTTPLSLKSKYQQTSKKLRQIRAKCFKLCQGAPKVAHSEPPKVPFEIIIHSSFPCTPTEEESTNEDGSVIDDVQSEKFMLHTVIVEECVEGFESSLVKASTVEP